MRAALLLVLCLGPACAAQPAGEREFSLAALRERAQEVEQVRLRFRQIKELELFDRPVVTHGVLDISRPLESVRWEFTDRAVLVLRHGVVKRWRADGTREHVGSGPATQALQGQMQALLSGDWSALDQAFVVHLDRDERRLRLEPRTEDMARYVTAIELVYPPDLTAPRSLVITAPGGDRTTYEFAEPEDPGALTVNRFEGP